MKGKIVRFKEDEGYGRILGEDKVRYFFHENDLAVRSSEQKDLLVSGKEVSFEIAVPEPEKGPAVKRKSLRIVEAAVQSASTEDAKFEEKVLKPVVPNSDAGLPVVRVSHEEKRQGILEITVITGRANDVLQIWVNGKIPSYIPRDKDKSPVPLKTLADGKAVFPVLLSDEEFHKGALMAIIQLGGSAYYTASWSRASGPKIDELKSRPSREIVPAKQEVFLDDDLIASGFRPKRPTSQTADEVSETPVAQKSFVDLVVSNLNEPQLVIRGVTLENQTGFMTLEIIHLSADGTPLPTKLIFTGKKASEWEIKFAEQDWQIGKVLELESSGQTTINVRIKQLAKGEFGGDHLIITADSGQTANIYIPTAFVGKPMGGSDSQKERIN